MPAPSAPRTRLAELRERIGTQEAVAEAAGIDQAYLSLIERGLRDNPSLKVVRSLAAALGVTPGHLVGLLEDEQSSGSAA